MCPILHQICADITSAIPHVQSLNTQAAIVNYYKLHDTLSCTFSHCASVEYITKSAGHVDESEWELQHPLVSITLGGLPAVYLSGSDKVNDATEPLAMWLRHGDVLVCNCGIHWSIFRLQVMSGAQRLVYHGVPAVLADRRFVASVPEDIDVVDDRTRQYLINRRLNISCRQLAAALCDS